MDKDIQSKYLDLVKVMNKHIDAYYSGKPTITDAEYDKLYRELTDIERRYPNDIVPNSPSQNVGTRLDTIFPKTEHVVRMFSLSNVFNSTELEKFYKRFASLRRKFGIQEVDQYYADLKCDGLSLDLVYNKGNLVQAITRGDGIKGDDVTANAFMINNIPKRIVTKKYLNVHGEVVVHRADFYAINQEREKEGKILFSNCRNYTVGSLKQKDPNVTKERLLKFYAWSLFIPDKAYTHHEQIDILIKLGFNTPMGTLCTSVNEIISFTNEVARIRQTIPFDIDGVVIKQDNPEFNKIIGWNSHEPLWATAWKFLADGAETTIRNVHWNMGKTGRLTPVASVDPVSIDGITISEVTLNNANYVENNKLGEGSLIKIIRSGDVIPKIGEIIKAKNYKGLPTTCPFCGSTLLRDSTMVKCINPECKEILKAQLSYIVSKDLLNIKGIGEKVIEEIVDKNIVHSFIDIFSILESGDSGIDQGLLDTLVTRVRNMNLLEFLMSLCISGLGRAVAGKLIMNIEDIEDLIRILNDAEEMRLLPINEGIKKNIIEWYSRANNKNFLEEVKKLQLEF